MPWQPSIVKLSKTTVAEHRKTYSHGIRKHNNSILTHHRCVCVWRCVYVCVKIRLASEVNYSSGTVLYIHNICLHLYFLLLLHHDLVSKESLEESNNNN